ncbi:MAG TPA: hypothetical protein DCM68_05165, partial [Verrucomicrobia bacterium]|nr:hypothetical protein [Verrucomicrobiota bacterium]
EKGKEATLRGLPQDLRRSKPAMESIHAAIRRLSDKTHPNLAAIRQLVHMGEQIYVVGDFAPGVDIGTWARAGEGGKRTLDETLPALRQIAAGLDFAHRQRIIHRNLKPTNVYLGPDGVVRVTDFGLAPSRHVTIVRGEAMRTGSTGPYLAPELREGGEADSAGDQYALAVLAWEILAGAPPEAGEDPPEDLPAAARAALRRALSPKPRNRFVTCSDFAKAMGGERVAGRRDRSAGESKRLRVRLGVAAGLVALGGALGAGICPLRAWLQSAQSAPPEKEAPPPVAEAEPPPAAKGAPQKLVATTPQPVEGQPWVTHTGGMEFVWVPSMQMWVGRYEVTNEEYQQKDPAHSSGDFREQSLQGARQPAVRVNFEDVAAYAAWLTDRERAAGKLQNGWRYRLPSRMEAITYTRAGLDPAYPWGEAWPPTRGNYADAALGAAFPDMKSIADYQDGFAATAPVEASGENVWGVFGAGGNGWETTTKASGTGEFGGWQGGGWDDHLAARLGCEVLYGFIGSARGAVNGFRLVLAPVSGEAPPESTDTAAASAAAPGS